MKKLNEKRARKLMFLSIGILAFIFGIMAFVSPTHALGVTTAMAFVIGGISYEGEEGMAKAIEDVTEKFSQKMAQAVSKQDVESIKAAAKEETKALIESVKASITEDLQAKIDEQTERLKSQGEAIELLKGSIAAPVAENDPVKAFKESVKAALMNSEYVEKYTSEGVERYRIKGYNQKNFGIEIPFANKAAVDMNTANAVRPGSSPGISIGYLTNYGMNPVELATSMNQHLIGAGFIVEPITDKYYGVIKEGTETNGAGIKAEDAAAGDSSWLWDSEEFKVFDFSAKFRVHQNTLDDMDRVANRVATVGIDRLLSVIDTNALNTSGDNTATPYGLRSSGYYTAYDTALRATTVKEANVVDVIKNMVLQANNQDFDQDALIINRTRVAEIESLKDQNANSVNLAGIRLDERGKLAYIYGLKVIINNKIPTTALITCKLSESLQFGDRQATALRMGYDLTGDFSKKVVTLQLDARAAIGIGNPLATIYCSDVAAAISALNLT